MDERRKKLDLLADQIHRTAEFLQQSEKELGIDILVIMVALMINFEVLADEVQSRLKDNEDFRSIVSESARIYLHNMSVMGHKKKFKENIP